MKNKGTASIEDRTLGTTGVLLKGRITLYNRIFRFVVVDINEYKTLKVSILTVFKHQKNSYS